MCGIQKYHQYLCEWGRRLESLSADPPNLNLLNLGILYLCIPRILKGQLCLFKLILTLQQDLKWLEEKIATSSDYYYNGCITFEAILKRWLI